MRVILANCELFLLSVYRIWTRTQYGEREPALSTLLQSLLFFCSLLSLSLPTVYTLSLLPFDSAVSINRTMDGNDLCRSAAANDEMIHHLFSHFRFSSVRLMFVTFLMAGVIKLITTFLHHNTTHAYRKMTQQKRNKRGSIDEERQEY